MRLTGSALIILALVLLGCGGCSKITFGYNHADWVLRYRINGYTSFNAGQKEQIRRDVADYMRWHRQHALPEYIAFLQNLSAMVSRKDVLTAEDIVRSRADSDRLYRMTVARLVRPAAHVLSTLDSRQIEDLRASLAENNRERKEEVLSGSEQKDLAMRAERHIHVVEHLVGHLTAEQEQAITEMSRRIPFATRSYIEQREAKQATLTALLNDRGSEDQIAALLREWVDTPESSMSPQQRQSIAAYEGAMNEMTAAIFGLLTPRQKDRLRRQISTYIGAFQELHSAAATVEVIHDHPNAANATRGHDRLPAPDAATQ